MIAEKDIKVKMIIEEISRLLKEKERSIAEICRALNIKRSTLIYYLNIMESQGIIEKERQEKEVTGRPTIVKLKKEFIENYNKKANEMKKLNRDILSFIDNKSEASIDSLQEHFSKDSLFIGLSGLERFKYISTYYKLTEKGKQLLESKAS